MIYRQNIFDQPVRNNLITYDNKRKILTRQGDNYITGCLLEHNHFKIYYKMIATDFSKQQAFDADLKEIQQINFTGNIENSAIIISLLKSFRFFIRNYKSILIYFIFALK